MIAPDDDELGLPDPGVQAERTSLSWQRTGFGLLAVGGLFTHLPDGSGFPLRLVCGLLLIVIGVLVSTFVAPLRYRQIVRAVRAHQPTAAPGVLLLLATPVVLVAALAMI